MDRMDWAHSGHDEKDRSYACSCEHGNEPFCFHKILGVSLPAERQLSSWP
jgi:hypothetical protein